MQMNTETITSRPPDGQRKRRLGRTVFILPSALTVGNIFCGFYALISTMRGNYDHAAQAIGIAIVLDMLDGRVARLTNSTTSFGLQLDSLADVISFGVAPAILAFFWGFQHINTQLGWIAAFTFTICGAMRLARFNVQAGDLKNFIGLPIPAAGGMIAATVHFIGDPVNDPTRSIGTVGAVFLLSFLMVSTIRYSSLKQLTIGRKSHLTVLIIALLVALIFYYSKETLLLMGLAYCSSGVLHRIFSVLRQRKRSEIVYRDPLEHH